MAVKGVAGSMSSALLFNAAARHRVNHRHCAATAVPSPHLDAGAQWAAISKQSIIGKVANFGSIGPEVHFYMLEE